MRSISNLFGRVSDRHGDSERLWKISGKLATLLVSSFVVFSVVSGAGGATFTIDDTSESTSAQGSTTTTAPALSQAPTEADLSDISWSTSDTVKIYNIDYSETVSDSGRTVGEDVIDTDLYDTGDGGWKRLEDNHLSGGYYYPEYLDTVTRTFEFGIPDSTETDLEQNTGPHKDFDDAVELRYGLWNQNTEAPADDSGGEFIRNSVRWEFDYFPDGMRTTPSLTMPVEEINRNDRALFVDARVLGDDDPGFGDNDNDDAVVDYSYTTYVQGANTEETYSFSLSDRKGQSVTGDATLSFDFDGVAAQRGAGDGKQLSISVNGNEVFSGFDSYVQGERTVQFSASYLTAGENDVTVSGPGFSGEGAYGFTISDLQLNANTDPDFDDDGVQNWNDPYPNTKDGDGDGLNDGNDPCPTNPNCDDTGKDDGADQKPENPDNDGDGLKDGEDPAPNTADADGDGLEDGNDPYPTQKDGDGDGLIDSNDPCPTDPNCDGTGKDDGADQRPQDPDNDGDGIKDGNDAAPNEAEDFDGCQDGDGAPEPDGPCTSDSDGDGIIDRNDAAPYEPEDFDGYQDNDGAPDPDNDGDGIPDDSDAEPNTAEDMDGCQDGDGAPEPDGACTSDSDGDGIIDSNDAAPYELEDFDGYQDDDGAPDPDNDGDGIPDTEDAAPNEAEDMDGCQDGDGAPEPEGACTNDSDGDGIIDRNDAAPDQPEDLDGFEDGDGEPDPDNDGDGIPDTEDAAPNEAEDFDGCEDSDGAPEPDGTCTNDSDGDGILDRNDAAPNKAEDMDGFEDGDGVPDPDNDGDGIPDTEDAAPNEAEDMDGCQDSDGAPEPDGACTNDSDGDGIPDSEDGAPAEPEDMDGFEDGDGVPDPDNDGDGIPDTEDAAPDTPEDMDDCEDGDGAPEPDGTCTEQTPDVSLTADSTTGTDTQVTFRVTNTGSAEGYVLDLALPEGWTVAEQTAAGGTWSAGDTTWLWQTIGSGEAVEPTVTFDIPDGASGQYTVTGSVLTADSVVAETSTTVTVTEATPVRAAIDSNGDGTIGDFEVLQAIDHWRTNDEVPNTGGKRIGDRQILTLIEEWRTNGGA